MNSDHKLKEWNSRMAMLDWDYWIQTCLNVIEGFSAEKNSISFAWQTFAFQKESFDKTTDDGWWYAQYSYACMEFGCGH